MTQGLGARPRRAPRPALQGTVELPDPNILGVPDRQATFVAGAYSALVRPLPPGSHTITVTIVGRDFPGTFRAVVNVVPGLEQLTEVLLGGARAGRSGPRRGGPTPGRRRRHFRLPRGLGRAGGPSQPAARSAPDGTGSDCCRTRGIRLGERPGRRRGRDGARRTRRCGAAHGPQARSGGAVGTDELSAFASGVR